MLQYIENLRKKPEAERRKAVFLISLYITLTIAIVWAIATSIRVAGTDFTFDTGAVGEKIPSIRETFSNIFDRASQILTPATTSDTTASDTPATAPTSTPEDTTYKGVIQ